MPSKPKQAGAVFLLVALLSLMWAMGMAAQTGPYTPAKLYDLQNLEQFRALFNEDTGTPRLLLLLSPT